MASKYEVAWNIFRELRAEILESQKIRAQIIGVKITLVSAGIGMIVANMDKVKIPSTLLVIPAFAAIFFDFLITSYSYSIKRMGYYCRTHLEPEIRVACSLPNSFILWQEFLHHPKTRQNFSHYGNYGLTFLALVPAVIALVKPYNIWASPPLLAALAILFLLDLNSGLSPWHFSDAEFPYPPVTPEKVKGSRLSHWFQWCIRLWTSFIRWYHDHHWLHGLGHSTRT